MSKKCNKEAEFWVSNVSDRNVTVRDLAMSIKARSNVNLLDSRHYSFTLEQLQESQKSGSLFAKRHFLKVREVPPPEPLKLNSNISKLPLFIADRLYSRLVIEEPKYEELEVSETDLIDELTNDDE